MDKSCFCGSSPTVRVVAGNDLTVEALLSLYDRDSGVYKPLDLSDASDVSLRLVGTFSKVQGKDTAVAGSKVSALFPAGSLGVGVYGVEVTFKDSEGNGRAFERNLIGIVATSGEATTESSAEGETGEGLNVTVDVKTRTVRIGGSGSGVTDYSLLDNKPSINGHTLEGDKTAEDLGLMPKGGAYTKEEADGRFETKEKAASDLQAVTKAIGDKVDKVAGKGLSKNDYTDEDKEKVRTALQTESDPTVPDWAKAATKPAYTAEEVGALPDTTKIPTKVSELENDSGYLTEHQPLDGYAKKTELPTKTSQLTNDSGFIDSTALAPFAKTGDVNAELKKKADKSAVEPYDCSWVFRLANGSEVTYEQHSELDRVIRSGRPLYASYKERNSSVIGYVDGHSDNWTEIGFLLYTSYGGGIRCVVSDYNMVDDGHYSEANTSYWELQERLVSGASIKTVNGESVLGAGDIKTPAPTKVSELENDKGYLTEHQSLEGCYQKTEAQLDHRVAAEAIASLAARLDAQEGSRGLLGDATAGTLDVKELTKCRYPVVMRGHGVPAEGNVPVNLPDGLPWDGIPTFVGQLYVNLDAASGGLYYAVGNEKVSDWKQA